MNEQTKRQLAREQLLLRYTNALDAGDMATVGAILEMAEADADLEMMILEINDVFADEMAEADFAQDAAVVRAVVASHLGAALPEHAAEQAVEPPPITVGNVIARIHADAAAMKVRVEREALAATRKHQGAETPLPQSLTIQSVRQLLEELGLKVSNRFQDAFRQTALFMRMGRNQGVARLAATRQQQSRKQAYIQLSTPLVNPLREVPPPSYEADGDGRAENTLDNPDAEQPTGDKGTAGREESA